MVVRMQTFLWIVLIPVLFLAAGCGTASLRLTMSDNGRPVSLHPGSRLVIGLESNPTTGYTWEVVQLDSALLVMQEPAQFKAASTGLVGAPGTQTLTFEALKTGTTTLTLAYHRPWETGVEPIHTFQIPITIR